MKDLSISAVIPAFNAESFLADAIDSVLTQTHPCIECIVIDDGSTDGTAEIARSYGEAVRYVQKPNGGDASARNAGARLANSEFVAFLDADDVWLPRKIEYQAELLEEDPELALVYSGVHVVDKDLNVIGRINPAGGKRAFRNTLLLETPYITGVGSTAVFRLSAFVEAGGFDERLRAAADWALACRVAAAHPVKPVRLPLALYRQHGPQVHSNLAAVEKDALLMYREWFRPGGLAEDLMSLRRRAYANLYVSLAGSYLVRRKDRRAFVRYLTKALVRRPDRVLDALARRAAIGRYR